jgi:ArsR family transcriptional regulator
VSNSLTDDLQIARAFKALSNPHRLAIFIHLARHCAPGQMCSDPGMREVVGRLGAGLGIAPSTVSHHLKELRQAGLIRMGRRGQFTECWVEPEVLDSLASFFLKRGG